MAGRPIREVVETAREAAARYRTADAEYQKVTTDTAHDIALEKLESATADFVAANAELYQRSGEAVGYDGRLSNNLPDVIKVSDVGTSFSAEALDRMKLGGIAATADMTPDEVAAAAKAAREEEAQAPVDAIVEKHTGRTASDVDAETSRRALREEALQNTEGGPTESRVIGFDPLDRTDAEVAARLSEHASRVIVGEMVGKDPDDVTSADFATFRQLALEAQSELRLGKSLEDLTAIERMQLESEIRNEAFEKKVADANGGGAGGGSGGSGGSGGGAGKASDLGGVVPIAPDTSGADAGATDGAKPAASDPSQPDSAPKDNTTSTPRAETKQEIGAGDTSAGGSAGSSGKVMEVGVGVGWADGPDGQPVNVDGQTIYMDSAGNLFFENGMAFDGTIAGGGNLYDQIEEKLGMSIEEVLTTFLGGSTPGESDAGSTETQSTDKSSGGESGSSDGSSDGANDDDDDDGGDDDDDDGGGDDEPAEDTSAEEAPEEADDGGDTGGDEGTPHPDEIEVDPAALAAFLESPVGREQRRNEERGIENNRSDGVTDPPEYDAAEGGVPVEGNIRFRGGDVDPVDGAVASSGFGPIDEMQIPGAGLIDPADFDGVEGGPEDPSKAPEPETDDEGGGGEDPEDVADSRLSQADLAFGSGAARDTMQTTSPAERMGTGDLSVAPSAFSDGSSDGTTAGSSTGPDAFAQHSVVDELEVASAIEHADVTSRLAEASSNLADKIDTESIKDQIVDQ